MTWMVLLLLLACSGAVSGSETALFGLTHQELRSFARSGNPFSRRAALLMRQPRRVLLTLLIANTAVNIAIFAVSFVTFENLGSTHPVWASFGGVAALIAVLLVGEILPKSIALLHASRVAPLVSAPVHAAAVALAPIRWVLSALLVEPATRLLKPAPEHADRVSTEELRDVVESSAHQKVITTTENEMLQAVIVLGDVTVRSIMVPRVDVSAVSIHDNRQTIRRRFEATRRSRLLVYGKDLDDVRGLLDARDFYLRPDDSIARLTRPVHFVPEQADLIQLIRHFRETQTPVAVVVDEHGGMAGWVTLSDVLEEIVGDLPSEEPPEAGPLAEPIDENTYRLSGRVSVRAWCSLLGVSPTREPADTLGGWVTARLGRLPRVGDAVRTGNLTLTVESVQRRRVDRLVLKRDPNGETANPAEPRS